MDKYGVRDRIRLNTKVVGASFDEQDSVWRIETAAGERLTARFVIGATGVFSQPKLPDIPGVDDVRRSHHAHLPLGSLGRPARQARRRDRHRRLGDPGDPGGRAGGGALDGLPAHPDLVPAQARRAA